MKKEANKSEVPRVAALETSSAEPTTKKGTNTMNSITAQQNSNVQQPTLPVIAGHEIAMDEHGRFNLNAIHKASGEGKGKAPSTWTVTKQSKELVQELASQTKNSGFEPIASFHGGAHRGTFAHELLAVSYAGWISPRFQLQVNQVFLDYRMGKLESKANIPALPSPLTPQHQHGLKSAVDSRAMQFPKDKRRTVYSRLWNHVKDTFEVARYQDIDDAKYQQALATVNSCPLEGDLIERDMPMALVTLDIPHRKSWQNYTVGELIGDSAPYSDLSSLMNQLNEARKTEASIFIKAIDGAFEEMKALRSLAERFDIKAWGLENRLSELRNHARAMQRISEYS